MLYVHEPMTLIYNNLPTIYVPQLISSYCTDIK